MNTSAWARPRRLAALGTVVAAAVGLLPLVTPASARAAATPLCTSSSHPTLAAKLSRDITGAMSGRTDFIAVTVRDPRTGVHCAHHSYTHLDSASVVKVTIMGAVLRRAMEQHRYLTSWEVSNLYTMITRSDNASASRLWSSLGMTRIKAFLRLCGMTDTVPGTGGYWGLTQITARDEMRQLDVFASPSSTVLLPRLKAYGLKLMSEVIPSQRWGAPYGAPSNVVVHVKNGWLPRVTHGWRVHSLGIFTGTGKSYRMAILTEDQSTMSYGVTTIQRIALVVHRDFNAASTTAGVPSAPPSVTAHVPEVSDGSAPYAPVTR